MSHKPVSTARAWRAMHPRLRRPCARGSPRLDSGAEARLVPPPPPPPKGATPSCDQKGRAQVKVALSTWIAHRPGAASAAESTCRHLAVGNLKPCLGSSHSQSHGPKPPVWQRRPRLKAFFFASEREAYRGNVAFPRFSFSSQEQEVLQRAGQINPAAPRDGVRSPPICNKIINPKSPLVL